MYIGAFAYLTESNLAELKKKLDYWIKKAKELDAAGKHGEADMAWGNAAGIQEQIDEYGK